MCILSFKDISQKSYIWYYHYYFTDHNVDTWLNLPAREAKKYSIYCGYQYAQTKFMVMLLRRKGERVIKGSLSICVTPSKEGI